MWGLFPLPLPEGKKTLLPQYIVQKKGYD